MNLKFSAFTIFLVTLASAALTMSFLSSCGSSSTTTTAAAVDYTCHAYAGTTITATAANQTHINVGCHYTNEPCVSVTICEPGTANCQTINDILLDTGSYGLRLFSCTHSLTLPSIAPTAGHELAEIVGYADGSCDWGPVKLADVVIGTTEKALNVPIHIIDYSYTGKPSAAQTGFNCTGLDYSPSQAGFNGILGVGLATTDCGTSCSSSSANGEYFSCASGVCTGTATPNDTLHQVTNPVAKMPTNNNGVILSFGSVALGGATSLVGTLTLGINTSAGNNTSTAARAYNTNGNAEFNTTYGGTLMATSFIDSGSNTYAFPNIGSAITACGSNTISPGFYCPAVRTGFSATQAGVSNGTSHATPFNVANAAAELSPSNPNMIFDDLASSLPSVASSNYFDWGFPFFIGKTVYSSVGTSLTLLGTPAPFWAW